MHISDSQPTVTETNFEYFGHSRLAIDKFSSSRSRDLYELNYKLVKSIKHIIVYPQPDFLTNVLREAIYHIALKKSKVHPVFKESNNKIISRYQPTTITPISRFF